MKYLPGTKIICLTYNELVPRIMTAENFRQLKSRAKIKVHEKVYDDVKYIVEFGSLRVEDKDKVIKQFGDPRVYIAMEPLRALVTVDYEARNFYQRYNVNPGGEHRDLPLNYQIRFSRQADWLGAIKKALTNKRATKDMLNITIEQLWKNFSLLINNDDTGTEGEDVQTMAEQWHDLPTSVDRLKARYNLFKNEGYAGLVKDVARKFGNDYHRKVSKHIEDLVLSLWAQQYKPYMAEVCKEYSKFMRGERAIVNLLTGEQYDPKDFYIEAPGQRPDKKAGKAVLTVPYELAESTVDYYVKKPVNEARINKMRMKALDFNTKYRPSVLRLAPQYAFSKITMDDLDIPFKTPDGDRAVKSYQVFDVASGAVIGVSFSRDKNTELIREALRDMFRLIVRMGWGVPWEIEFERHLTEAMAGGVDDDGVIYDDILTQGAVFPTTRMCKGGNAKEKRAEGFIRVKKYGLQKKRPGFQARHYARLLTNRLNSDKDKMRYEYEQIVQNELEDIATHNATLHPKQDLYPGLTRWQVLEQYQNPELPKFSMQQVIQFIGHRVETSIRAGAAQVNNGFFVLPDILMIDKQKYNGKIEAYYLPDDMGLVNSVHLFEDGRFLCEAMKKVGFQEALAEQTDVDRAIMQQQWGQQSRFDAFVRNEGLQREIKGQIVGAIAQVGTTAQIEKPKAKSKKAAMVPVPVKQETDNYYLPMQEMNAAQRALADF